MRRMRSIMGPLASNTAGYAALQATTAGTPLTLVGTPQLPNPSAGQLHNSAAPITFTSAGNVSAVNFTCVGYDRRGQIQTEIIAGPNATTVSGHLLFNKIISITPNTTQGTTVSAGWGSRNYGPWLIIAYHSASINASLYSGSPTFDIKVTDFNFLDPTYFHASPGGGGTPTGDMNFQGSGIAVQPFTGGPYIDQPVTAFPMVPAALQTSCPQLLGTNQCLPEEDGTYSNALIAPVTFTAAAPGAAGSTAAQLRLDPIVAFAWRIENSGASGLVELDITPQRRGF